MLVVVIQIKRRPLEFKLKCANDIVEILLF